MAYERLEPCVGKLTSTVLMGLGFSNEPRLPDHPRFGQPGQPYGEEASRELKKLILGQTVEVTLTGEKTYKREVCLIRKDAIDINLEMVKRGYAWAYRHYLKRPYASEYIEAENDARTQRLGLWADTNPTPPWEFRRKLKGK